jgi:hypothetical protein
MGDLSSLSVPLWILAVVATVETLAMIAIAIGGYVFYFRVTRLVRDLEAQQIAPIRVKVDAILADVKGITARASHRAERVDDAIAGTMERVDETATRVRAGVHGKVSQAAGVVRGVRAAIVSVLQSESHA